MRKNLRLTFLAVAAALVLSSCAGAKSVPLDYSDGDLNIETEWVDYSVPASGIVFEEGQEVITLEKGGEPYTYKAEVSPKKATLASVRWESSDESVATVLNGTVTAVGGGSSTITVSSFDDSFDEINLTVNVIVPLQSFTVSPNNLDLDFNEEAKLKVDYLPTDTTQKGVTFTSGNEDYVTVDASGNVVAKKLANNADVSTTITVHSDALGAEGDVVVAVRVSDKTIHATGVKVLNGEEEISNLALEVGQSVTLTGKVLPDNATYKDVTWSSSKPNQLSVTSEGKVTAVVTDEVVDTPINAVITANAENNKSFDLPVTISESIPHELEVGSSDVHLDTQNIKTAAIEVIYKDGSGNPMTPSVPTPKFELTSGEGVIAVNAAGEITALSDGAAVITVTDNRYSALLAATVNVSVVKGATGIELNTNSLSMMPGDEFDLTAQVLPTDAHASFQDVSFEITSGDIVISGEETSSNVFHVVAGANEGNAVITASVGNVTATCNVKITNEGQAFTAGKAYVVGMDKTEALGFGGRLHPSWNDSRFAFEFENKTSNPNAQYEWYGQVEFEVGDQWKIREGDTWRGIYDSKSSDEGSYGIGRYKIDEGAFAAGDMEALKDNEGSYTNVKVNTAGLYDIYYAFYSNEHPEGWFEVYVEAHRVSFDKSTVTFKTGATDAFVNVKNWEGTPAVVSSDSTGLEVLGIDANGKVSLAPHVAGTYTLTATDSSSNEATCIVHVVDAGDLTAVYLIGGFNGWAQEDLNYNMTKVSDDKYTFENITLSKADGFKIYDTSKPDPEPGQPDPKYVSNSETWTGCGFSLDGDGNIVPSENGRYTIDYYPNDTQGHHVVLNWLDAPTTHNIHIGSNSEWTTIRDVLMTGKDNDSEWFAKNVALAAGEEFAIHMIGDDWRNYTQLKPSSPAKDNFEQAGEENYNFKVKVGGNYDIYVKVVSDYEGTDAGKSVYIAEHTPEQYKIQYHDGTDWQTVDMTANVGETEYSYSGLALAAGNKFVVNMNGIWRHYDDLKVSDFITSHFEADGEDIKVKAGMGGSFDIYVSVTPDGDGNYIWVEAHDEPLPTGNYYVQLGSADKAELVEQAQTEEDVNVGRTRYEATLDVVAEESVKFFAGESAAASTQITSNIGPNPDGTGVYNNYMGTGASDWTIQADADDTLVQLNVYSDGIGFWIAGGNSGTHTPPVPVENRTIYFCDNVSWGTAYIYVVGLSESWPGEEMTKVGTDSYGQACYSYTVDINAHSTIVFSNGTGGGDNQTTDISITGIADHRGFYCNTEGETHDGEGKRLVTSYDYGLSLSETDINVEAGEDFVVHALTPIGTVEALSNDTETATIASCTLNATTKNYDIIIHGVAEGTTTISVSDESGAAAKTINVTVSPVAAKVKVYFDNGGSTYWGAERASTSILVYFTKPNSGNWGEVYAYAWKDGGSENAAWPGVAATWVKDNEYGEAIMCYEVDTTQFDKIIFNNNNAGKQTANIPLTVAAGATSDVLDCTQFYCTSGDEGAVTAIKYADERATTPYFYAWVWETGHTGRWVALVPSTDHTGYTLELEVDANETNIIFARCPYIPTSLDGSELQDSFLVWNKTADLVIPGDGYGYVIVAWDSGNWSANPLA